MPATGENRFLTEFNKERIAQIDWQPPREFWFTSKTGRRIQSLLVLPPGSTLPVSTRCWCSLTAARTT